MERTSANFFQYLTVLFIDAQLEGFFAVGIKGQEVEIIIGAAMEHAAASVNGSVYQRAGIAGIFGLHMILMGADANICVMAKNHVDAPR